MLSRSAPRLCPLTTLMLLALLLEIAPAQQAGQSPPARPVPEAPFGLQWGMSADQVRGLGVSLTEIPADENGTQFRATDLPKTVSDLETTVLSFGFHDGLWRVASVSETFENDPYGLKVRTRYEELQKVLANKYGQPVEHHHQDTELWKDRDEFLAGISAGRSWHFSSFDSTPISVQLSIRASALNDAYYVVIFKDSREEDRVKADNKRAEEDAF